MIVQHSRLLYADGDGNIQSQRRGKPYGKQNTRRIQTMTNKAKTYLKNIQEADTEKKLISVEIAFKQDMTISCSDLGSLVGRQRISGTACGTMRKR